ncbi:Undecaprenyl-diphosphatase [uncultured archaeon]|nr:Undecaprenyl-diphosphatase [uncultured archaeon]
MKKNKRAILFIVFAFLILISFYFDVKLSEYASLLRNDFLDKFFLVITYLSSEILIFFILTALFLWRENKRRWIIPLWSCLGISAIVSFLLKFTIQRLRPFQLGIVSLLPRLQEASFAVWNYSFPSFQSMFAFCAIPILAKQFPRLKKFWIIFAVLIAFSRVYFGLHFFSDVILGALIGYIIGLIIVRLENEEKFSERIINKIFRR